MEKRRSTRNERANKTRTNWSGQKKEDLEHQIKILLLPQDENDSKNIIIEIRAGTGGEEAALLQTIFIVCI